MKRLAFGISVLSLFWIGRAASAQSEIAFTLVPNTDLSQFQIHQTVTIQVNVSGATIGQEFDSLAAQVTWDAGRFGLPAMSPGVLVPNNPADFLAFTDSEVVDVAFLTFGADPADHIVADAESFTFFSFDVTAVGAGPGSFQLGAVAGSEFDPLNPPSSILLDATAGAPLEFAIVPEPSGMALAAAAGFLVLARRLRRPAR